MNDLAKEMFETAVMMNSVLSGDKYRYDGEYDGERIILEKKTQEGVKEYLDNMFADKCIEEGIENGEEREDEAYILKFDIETGDVVERTKYNLSYEGYHGDLEEHAWSGMFI